MAINRADLNKLDQILQQAQGLSDSALRFLRAELVKMIGAPGVTTDEPTPFKD